ncbi:hypothetical protein UFOVP449_158 [uncultured Caudovirales phage]|uniref:Uncharacterized protein n=1 Tax=uncultured Caudovirales phage TaxID=2100421 RepID=A0A6J5ME30_9CAUD|nr:hypothetical protein UFOVP449_158 [uncultured Caudovirales phage]
MSNFNPIYKKYIDDKNIIKPEKMLRGKFYLIKEYITVDGIKKKYTETTAPIIFVLFVSLAKNIVHAVKISNINPNVVRKFFGKFVNEETETIQMRGSSKQIYEKIISKQPTVTGEAYRTYNISGITKVIELTMDVNELTPKAVTVRGIDVKSQKRNI